MIEGVKVKRLKFNCDERGRLMEILRCDDQLFQRFGQVYMTTAFPNVIKGWHAHRKQTDNICCIKGTIKLVIYDQREGSATLKGFDEFTIGEENPMLVQIPPLVWHGFKNIGSDEAIVVNVPTEPYDHEKSDELRMPLSNLEYDW